MPRSPSPSPSSSPERHPPVRRRGSGASHMQLQNHNHHHRRRSPSPPCRRALRPRRAAAASSRPLVDDFFPFPSSPSTSPSRNRQRRPSPEPSSSDSGGGAASASDRRRRKLKLVVKLSQLPPDQHHRRVPPPPPYSDDSDGEEEVREDGSGDEDQVKPLKKRRIEPRGDRSRHQETGGGRSDAASAPRTKRLPVPGTLRTTPLPGRNTLDLILDKLQKKDTYGVFAEPVDPEELPDYHDVIEHPMDFGTVRRKLARNVYRSFEQFEDDVFLICSNAMQYNAPDTIYFRQAHLIQELARKKFQELRDEGIPTENQIKSEQKFRPNSCNREPIKKPVFRHSNDDTSFLSRKEQLKRPNIKGSEGDIRCKGQVKKPISRTLQDESSIFHKERIKKPVSKNSEGDLSPSFHKERVKKLVSRNSEDDLSSSVRKEQVRKAISRNSENDERSSFHQQQVKKPSSQSSKDGLSSHKKSIRKPICGNREDPCFSSYKEPVENSVCTNGEDAGVVSTEKLAEIPISKNREDNGPSHQNSSNKHICRDVQDDVGYSCNEEVVAEPVHVNSQGALGSDVSGATIASVGDGSNGLSTSQTHGTEPAGCSVANGVLDKGISSPQDEIRSEKTEDISAKACYKSIVVDETRRKTYDTSEEQLPLESDPVFDVFSGEPKELINVGIHSDNEYAYARSMARFAGSLGAQGWRIVSERIRQALPAEVKYGRGWVGEYEPLLPSILIVNDQSRNLKSSEGNVQRNASVPRDNDKFRQTERNNPKDMSLSLLNRINTGNNVAAVPAPLESPELKPRIFGVTAEPLQRSTNTLPPHENQRVTGNVTKAKRRSNEQMRKCNSSSGARSFEIQPQRPECSKGASTVGFDVPSLNKGSGQPRSFFQPPEAVRTQQISRSNIPIETGSQRCESVKGASGMHDMPSSNGQPKPFFQSQEAATPQPRNEAAWVCHGRPGDVKVGMSNKNVPSTSIGFISNNQAVNATNFAMNMTGQKNFSEPAKSMGSTAVPGHANIRNRGLDTPRNMFATFPAAVRENQSIPSAQGAQSWISFGASAENRAAMVSPTFLDSNSGWKMPFANVRPADDAKVSSVPQFFRQPVQPARESPAQNKGLVIFPQLVQTDFSRSQGQPQLHGLVSHLQQKPNKDALRPDLNIGFPSPGSPPARQSSGINLEAQQPDLALQL